MIFSKYNGYQADGGRSCYKGGDGGAGAARAMEEDRQRRIRAAIAEINRVFDDPSRNDFYDEHKQAIYDINSQDVTRQYGDAERNNRFGLARYGLMGGSVDIDSNAELQRKANEGLMKSVGVSDDAAANLKLNDERSKQSLITLAQSGIDSGTAQSMALQSLDAQTQNALGARAGATIGGIFNNLSQAYLSGRYSAGQQSAINNLENAGSVNSTRSEYGGSLS